MFDCIIFDESRSIVDKVLLNVKNTFNCVTIRTPKCIFLDAVMCPA